VQGRCRTARVAVEPAQSSSYCQRHYATGRGRLVGNVADSRYLNEMEMKRSGHTDCTTQWLRQTQKQKHSVKFMSWQITMTTHITVRYLGDWGTRQNSQSLTQSPLWFYTHTHTFNGPLSRTTRVSRYQKGKTNLDLTEARDGEWQWHQLGHM